MTSGEQLHSALQPRATVEQYELLLAAALGTTLPPEARSGLTVLLHRCLWAWARAIMLGSARQQPAPLPMVGPSITNETLERRTVIHLLAAMAMAVSERRTA